MHDRLLIYHPAELRLCGVLHFLAQYITILPTYANDTPTHKEAAKEYGQKSKNRRVGAQFQYAEKSPHVLAVAVQARSMHESNDHDAEKAKLRFAKDCEGAPHEWIGSYRLHSGDEAQSSRALRGASAWRTRERSYRRAVYDCARSFGCGRSGKSPPGKEFVWSEKAETRRAESGSGEA